MTQLSLDYEAFSRVDLKEVGSSVYSRHASTKVLMAAFRIDNEKPQQWVPEEGERMPRDLRDALRDPSVIKRAWNAQFERQITEHVLGIPAPPEQWRCTMVMATSLSLPGKLEKAGEVVDIPADKRKMARGTALIKRFCKPRKPTKKLPYTRATFITDPEEWEEFKLYNRQDEEAETAIYRRIRKWDLPAHEWELWCLDQRINARGIYINIPAVKNAIKIAEHIKADRMQRMQEITGLENPNSVSQLLGWLRDEHGYPYLDLRKPHVEKAAREMEDKEAVDVLNMRLEISKSSVKKYDALLRATDDDSYLRNTLQFAGAGRTWRWSGRIFQPQNLARPAKEYEKCQEMAVRHVERLDPESIELLHEKPMDLLSTCVRPVVTAPDGYVLIDADLNAIENRILGWLADDKKILRVFEQDRDPYVDFATYMYDAEYDDLYAEYKDGDKEKRTIAKPGVLGCGYMLSAGEESENPKTGEMEATGLLGYARDMGIQLTPEQAELSVRVWRETYKAAVQFWDDIDQAARRCIRTGKRQYCGPLEFDISGPFMRMILPSGRALHYCRPRLELWRMPWGGKKISITYENMDENRQWRRISTHPGKLTENADQAIARDVLAHGMMLAEEEGIDLRLHVHDQNLALAKENRAEKDLKILMECMSVTPSWAKGLPLAAAGTISKVFMKD